MQIAKEKGMTKMSDMLTQSEINELLDSLVGAPKRSEAEMDADFCMEMLIKIDEFADRKGVERETFIEMKRQVIKMALRRQ